MCVLLIDHCISYGYPNLHHPCCPVPALRRIHGGSSPGTQPGRSEGSDWWLLAHVAWLCWARRDAAQGSLWLDPYSLARIPSAASPSGSGHDVVGALWSVSRHALIALPSGALLAWVDATDHVILRYQPHPSAMNSIKIRAWAPVAGIVAGALITILALPHGDSIFIFIVVLLVAIGFMQETAEWRQLTREAELFAAQLTQTRSLPVIQASIGLEDGESAFFSAESVLYEEAMEGDRLNSCRMEYCGIGVVRPALEVMRGVMTVTNKRIIFVGTDSAVRSISLANVRAVEPAMNAVSLTLMGGQKKIFLTLMHGNPLILWVTILICARNCDPVALPDEALNIKYQLSMGTGIHRHSRQ